MIILYPKEFEGRHQFPKNLDVFYYECIAKSGKDDGYAYYTSKLSGLYDTFVLSVGHVTSHASLNYLTQYSQNLHLTTTLIDCRYHSDRLDLLITKITKIEDIWND